LIELLITLGVTTIGLVGLVALHLSVARGNDGAGRSNEANAIGNRTIEELRAMRLSDMMTTLGSVAPPIDTTVLGTVAGRNNVTYGRRVKVTSVTPAIYRIRVEITWTDDNAATNATVQGQAGLLDHSFATEILRNTMEAL
jgi:hypothetical protein